MKFKKVSFAIVVYIISGLIFGSVCFFSLYFFTYGNLGKSIVLSLLICAILWIMVLILKKIKQVRRNFAQHAYLEILMFIVFLTIGIILLVPFTHYFTVYNRKAQVKEKIGGDLDNVAKMFDRYEEYSKDRLNKYEFELNAAIAGKDWNYSVFKSAGFNNNGESLTIQKNRLLTIFKDDLMPGKYDSTKKYALNVINDYKQLMGSWVIPVTFLSVINNVEKTANDWLKELKKYDSLATKTKSTSFEHTITFSSIKDELTQPGFPSLIAIFCASILYFLLLIPYFIAYRDPRNSGLISELFKRKVVSKEGGAVL